MGGSHSFQHRRRVPFTPSSSSFVRPARSFVPGSASSLPLPRDGETSLEPARRYGYSLDRIAITPPELVTPAHFEVGQQTDHPVIQKCSVQDAPQASLASVDTEPAPVETRPRLRWNVAAIPLFPDSVQRERDVVREQHKNTTGLPDTLKAGVETLSGLSLNDVQVHYHSSKPASLQALAYTQGTDIHVGSGQERHLAHEAWHVVQQKQGRVKPTSQVQGAAINDDEELEREADVMGAKAATAHAAPYQPLQLDEKPVEMQPPIQRMLIKPDGTPLKNLAYYKKLYERHQAAIDSLEKKEDITVKNQREFEELITQEEKESGLPRAEDLKEEESDVEEEGEESEEDGKAEVEEEEGPLAQPLPLLLQQILREVNVKEDIKQLNDVLNKNLPDKVKVSERLYKAVLFEGNPIDTRGMGKTEQLQLLYLSLKDKSSIASCYPAATRLLELVGVRDERDERVESFHGGGETDSFKLSDQQKLIKKLSRDLQKAAGDKKPIIFKIQLGGRGKGGHGFTLTVQGDTIYQLEALAGQGSNANILFDDIMRGGRKRTLDYVVKALQSIASADPNERKTGAYALGWNANAIGLITEDESAIVDPMNVYWTASVLASETAIRERVAEQISETRENIRAIMSKKPVKRRKLT